MTIAQEYIEHLKHAITDRYTASELVEILDISVEDIVEIWIEAILDNKELINSVR